MNVSKCSSCKASIIWMKTKTGKKMPVDWREDLVGMGEFDVKTMISHFSTCKDANTFRKPNKENK